MAVYATTIRSINDKFATIYGSSPEGVLESARKIIATHLSDEWYPTTPKPVSFKQFRRETGGSLTDYNSFQ